ncbi:MAG: DNA methyltransferase [Candidatus Kapabacteria bacterium]|nr:DNA methyltransferase [Candidatus Kapabacteria bacterium]
MNKYINNRVADSDWDFLTANTKEYTHCYHIYPAMMIPQIARRLIKDFAPQNTKVLFDPYCGTGTSLIEANLVGYENVGTDLNPLARLISKVKSTNYNYNKIKNAVDSINDNIFSSSINGIDKIQIPNFINIDYWFSKEILNKLGFLQLLINELNEEIRDFFLVPFSETIREVSYTRNSEFKLYRIEKEKIPFHNPDVFKIFLTKINRNVLGLIEYNNNVKQTNTKVFDFNTCAGIPQNLFANGIDLIVTSPPYGDSRTTVAYGQFSRLANQWLGVEDASGVDNNLMGGKNNVEYQTFELKSANEDLQFIKEIDYKRYNEVKSFLIDYKKSIDNISPLINEGGMICYVVGNRRVKNRQIQLDAITAELFENNGFKHITTIVRSIPNKRMPSRNSPSNVIGDLSATMTKEYIVILKK